MRNLRTTQFHKAQLVLKCLHKCTIFRFLFILFLVFVNLNFILGQSCNCTYDFGTHAGSTSLWSSAGVGGSGYVVDKTICVQGTLIIDVDARFLNCTFMMHPGSTIHVANFILFKAASTNFKRCGLINEMWNGIITTWGSQLDFNNNTISDANIGIYCYPNSNITQLIQNKFNRCFIGIEAYEIIAERPFVGNRFYSDGSLLPPKSGFPFAGMRIINTVGLISERSGFYEHMNWGIELYNSNYIGENITMQNGPTSIAMLNPGIGILSHGSNFTINNSYFRRIPFGIWSDQRSSSTITNNHFINIAFGVLVQNSPNLTINIHNNMMDTIRTSGIFIKDCAPHLETLVSDNMIVFSSNSLYGQPTESCFGITIDNDGDRIEAGRETQIFNNHVYQNTASPPTYFFGYFLYNT